MVQTTAATVPQYNVQLSHDGFIEKNPLAIN